MPRDGSNIYSQPFPDVVEDTTIESTVYNGFTNDVAADLNAPRPIVAGGTGATSADQALFNLAAEKAAQIVTNYDSHLWVPGSFRSATTATGAPVVDHAFAGVCYISEALANPPTNQNVVVEAIDTTDPTNIVKYIRVKNGGIWGLWSGVSSGSAAASIGEYTFDTGITFPPGSGQIRLNNATQNSATEIFISHTTALGGDATNLIPFAIKSGSDIAIQDKDEIAKYKIFTATANPVLSGGDYRVTVAFKSGGTDIATAQRVLVGATGGGVVRYDVAQTLTANQQAQGRANIAVTKKNYIINGGMQISQENGVTAGSMATVYYPVDMFSAVCSSSGVATAGQIVLEAPGSLNRMRITVTTADAAMAAGDHMQIITNVEGWRAADLHIGLASAKTVTLQFGCKGPAGTYGITFHNHTPDRFYATSFTITAGEANTDVVKSVTVPLDTTGTWAYTNFIGLGIRWWLMGGTTFQAATPNVWTGTTNSYTVPTQSNFMATNGNVFELFDVSLTEGSVAPPFVVPDYASELAACQRYYKQTQTGTGVAVSTTTVRFIVPTGPMRVGPAVSVYGAPLQVSDTLANFTQSSAAVGSVSAGKEHVQVDFQNFTGLTTSRFHHGLATGGFITLNARL